MKKAIHLIAVYFVSLFISTIAIAFGYMLIKTCMETVAGKTISVFSLYYFKNGCLLVLPFACILALLFLLLSAIKANDTSVLSFFIALFFFLLSWLIILPISLAKTPHILLNSSDISSIQLSTNIFRMKDDIPKYYLQANEDGTYRTLSIYKNAFNGKELVENPDEVIPRKMFADPLVEKTVGYPFYIQKFISVCVSFYFLARNAVFSGKIAWVSFASLGLCLFSLWMIVGTSRWRMVDFIVVCGFYAFFFALQVQMYTDTKIHSFILSFFNYMSLPDSFKPFINPFIYIVLAILIGIISSVKRYKIAKLGVEE
ncbi:MAG: hypothetical protein BKP49_07325 [Treponema sp. CETP13]|nr:MAG: hypothetical protein BKP49_07325 [Treponema sp. CETP13]